MPSKPRRNPAKPGDLVGWRITVTAPNGIAQEHFTVYSPGEAARLADYFQTRGWKYESREIRLSFEEWKRSVATDVREGEKKFVYVGACDACGSPLSPKTDKDQNLCAKCRAARPRDRGESKASNVRECGAASSLHEPLLAIAEGGVYGLGACSAKGAMTKSTSNVALSAMQFDRFVPRPGGGGDLVREAEVPIDVTSAKAWMTGKVCLPWVRVTRDPKNFKACAARAKALGPMTSSAGVFRLLGPVLEKEDVEVFLAVLLDSQLRLRAISEIARGGRSKTSVSVPDTLRVALVEGASAVIVAHNHPSGQEQPSDEDKQFTKVLAWAFHTVGVELVDHMVIGHSSYWSFADHGLLPIRT